MSKAAIPVIIALGVGGLALFLLTREAKAAPPEVIIPTIDDIMGAESIAELNAWYNLIGELYIIGKISSEEYMTLYEAYRARFYELVGVTE